MSPPLAGTDPQLKRLHSLLWGREKKHHHLSRFSPSTTFAKQIATLATCSLGKATCESPLPFLKHTSTTCCSWKGVIKGGIKGENHENYRTCRPAIFFLCLVRMLLISGLDVKHQPADADWSGRSPLVASTGKQNKKGKGLKPINSSPSEWDLIWK